MKTAAEERELTVQREDFKAAWRQAMKDQGIDFILCPVHPLPPIGHKKTPIATLIASNYSFMYNIVSLFQIYTLTTIEQVIVFSIYS